MRDQRAAVDLQDEVPRHSAERPLAQAAVAEGACHNQIDPKVPGDLGEARGLRPVQGRGETVRLDAMPGEPVADVCKTALRRFPFVLPDEFDDVDPPARL